MEQVRDPFARDWWQYYYEPMDAHQMRSDLLGPQQALQICQFAYDPAHPGAAAFDHQLHGGHPFGQDSAGQHRQWRRRGRCLGADGHVLLGLFHVTLAEQAELSPDARRRYLALIDEFQVYQGADFRSCWRSYASMAAVSGWRRSRCPTWTDLIVHCVPRCCPMWITCLPLPCGRGGCADAA